MTTQTQQIEVHQQLMDEAYDLWEKNEGWSYDDFVDELDGKHRAAVLLGNLNYQVCNGGFSQWHLNDYSSQIERLLKLTKRIDTPTSAHLTDILEEIKDELEYGDDDNYDFDRLDRRYYTINEQLMEEVEAFLQNY